MDAARIKADNPLMPDQAASAALSHLRAHHSGMLIADEVSHPTKYVLDGGRLVFPAPGTVLEAFELVLFVPREDPADEPELQLMLEAAALDPASDAGADRWRVYHGEPRLTKWAACRVTGARFDRAVVEAEEFRLENPLAAAEPGLCKRLNADRAALTAICRPRGVEPKDPVAVGIDPEGIDVRARFGILRVPLPRAAADAQEAGAMIDAMLRDAMA